MIRSDVQQFYSKIRFPGHYTLEDLDYYNIYQNQFLEPYVDAVKRANNVLEIGCGTGYITNLVARQNPKVQIHAIDFSDSIDDAKAFSKTHKIKNVTYYKQDFLQFVPKTKYDLIISNGVLHHIKDYVSAIDKINSINADEMILGVYNTYGKILKKLVRVAYINELLRTDQEDCPYETSFTVKEFCNYFTDYTLESIYPGGNLRNLFNYKNGGLTIYHFARQFG